MTVARPLAVNSRNENPVLNIGIPSLPLFGTPEKNE
jgi:hypothetical protein